MFYESFFLEILELFKIHESGVSFQIIVPNIMLSITTQIFSDIIGNPLCGLCTMNPLAPITNLHC